MDLLLMELQFLHHLRQSINLIVFVPVMAYRMENVHLIYVFLFFFLPAFEIPYFSRKEK